MKDFVVMDNDQVQFIPAFGAATVVVQPVNIKGSGNAFIEGRKICIEGDESSVEVPGCMYQIPGAVAPGTGTITIQALGGDQLTSVCTQDGKKLIIKGSMLTAKFKVQSPAMLPGAPPVSDPVPEYSGQGQFMTANQFYQAE